MIEKQSTVHELALLPIEVLREAVKMKEQRVEKDLGLLFVKYIPLERYLEFPEVPASDLCLNTDSKYHQDVVRPMMMGKHTVIRGSDGWNRPFLAMKIELLDKDQRKVAEVVELVFRRFDPSLFEDGSDHYRRDNWVSALANMGNDGKSYSSFVYSSGDFAPKNYQAVQDLLDGKIIPQVIERDNGIYFARLAQ